MATINHKTYNEGTETFKDFSVYDGKDTLIFKVDGSSSNVGIGISAPTTTLHLDASGGATIRLQRTSVSSNRFDVGTDGTNMEFNVRDTGAFTFGGGSVGIGTGSPAQLLTLQNGNTEDVSGSRLRMNMATNPYWELQANNGGTSADRKFVINTSAGAGDVLTLTQAGNVGIGTSTPAQRLDISNGAIKFERITTGALTCTDSQGLIYSLINNIGSIDGLRYASRSHRFVSHANTVYATIDSDGLKFGSDTLQVNALDDYEEGTFTPSVEGSSTSGTATYSVQIGKYTKIGNQISILIDLAWSGGTGTGILRIVGLPFTNVAFNTAGTIGFIDSIALTASNYATFYVAPSSTRLDFVQSPTGGGSVTDVPYDAAGRLIVSATYFNA